MTPSQNLALRALIAGIICFTIGFCLVFWQEKLRTLSLPSMPAVKSAHQIAQEVSFRLPPAQIEKLFGPPDYTQEMNGGMGHLAFWYYRRDDGLVQIGFEGNYITSVNRY